MDHLTAHQIIKIKEPGALFTGDKKQIHKEFRQLAKKFHPDVNKEDGMDLIFRHIQELYQWGLEMLDKGTWSIPGVIEFKDSKKKGHIHKVTYKKKCEFELGQVYIDNLNVTYIIDDQYRDLVNQAFFIFGNFRYSSDRMRKEISKYLPQFVSMFAPEGKHIGVIIKKTQDVIPLRTIFEYHQKNKIDQWDKHVAWIISSLYNILCYFEYANITHNDISLDTYFISPPYHSGVLLGGWWYSAMQDAKLMAVPYPTYDLLPLDIKKSKLADVRVDLELIKALGRELLGDRTGGRLLTMKPAPIPMINWLKHSSSGKALDDYTLWQKVLYDSFGDKKFIEMIIDLEKIYE